MPVTYLTHPDHGATHAYDSGEVKRLEGHGWKVGKEPTAAEVRAMKADTAHTGTVAPEVAPEKKKPGRKPKAVE